jgi:hypothetical protein
MLITGEQLMYCDGGRRQVVWFFNGETVMMEMRDAQNGYRHDPNDHIIISVLYTSLPSFYIIFPVVTLSRRCTSLSVS